VIGLPKDPKFNDPLERNKYTLKSLPELDIPLLNAAIKQIRARNDEARFQSFTFNDEYWWAGFEEYPVSNDNNFIIGVIVPESDFSKEISATRQLLVGGFIMITLFFVIVIYAFAQMKSANKIIAREKDNNEKLLLNTLPVKVVNDLKVNGKSEPENFHDVTVCFSDIVGFTQASSKLDPKKLINELNEIYTAFDEIMIKYDCERIKTIGDAYLAVCGMPQQNTRHAEMMLRAALDIIRFTEERSKSSALNWKIRIGLHSGNVVGGIVGIKKYIYDVFGDTINTASRMESYSVPMKVNISSETYDLVKDTDFVKDNNISFEKREPVNVKGKGAMEMYFVIEGQ
jgi:class 3 adenylate cyclase